MNALRCAASIPGQVNPVKCSYQPLDNEVWAQLHDTPETFIHDSFESRDIEPNIREITGTLLATGETATAAYCFAGPEHDQNTAQEWLATKDIKFAKLEPAKLVAYKQVTAKASSVIFPRRSGHNPRRGRQKLPTIDIDPLYAGGKVQPAGCPGSDRRRSLRHPHEPRPGPDRAKTTTPTWLSGTASPPSPAAKVRFDRSGLRPWGRPPRKCSETAANGFEWQASIGPNRVPGEVNPTASFIAGETIRANGQTFQGPLIYWPTSLLVHAALTGQGADPETHVTIAAKAAKPQGVRKMDEFELWVKDTLGLEPSTLTDSGKHELRASYNAMKAAAAGNLDIDRQVAEAKKRLGLEVGGEMVRLNKVRACFDKVVSAWSKDQPEHVEKRGKAEELRAKATANEGNAWSTEKIELEFFKLGYPSKVISNTQGNAGLSQNVLECAAAHTTMMADAQIAKHWTPETIEAARHPSMRGIGLKGLIFQCARAKGYTGDWIQNDAECKEALLHAFPNPHSLRAEASTFQLPGLLSNLMNKYLEQGFWEVEKVYQEISTSRPVKDFKPNP